MPEFSDHEFQATHNSKLLGFLSGQAQRDYSDWYLTIAFYTAVHLVESLLNANSQNLAWTINSSPNRTRVFFKCSHSEDGANQHNCHSEHEFRLKILKENRGVFGNMYIAFKNLYERSRNARYDCYLNRTNDFHMADSWIGEVRREYSAAIKRIQEPPARGLARKL